MRTIAISLLLISGLLAGCADETAGPAPAPEEDAFNELDTKATTTTGVIRGIVITETIVPIVDATVQVTGLGAQSQTNEDGAFAFSSLEPGTYFLKISKVGFNPVQTSTTVVAGEDKPAILKIVLAANPSAQPFTELQQWNAYLQCGVGLGVGGASTNPCFLTGSDNVHGFDVQRPVDTVQVEMIWDGTNVFGDTLSVGLLRPGTISNFAGADSGSPAIFRVDHDRMVDVLGENYTSYTVRVFPGTSSPVSVVLEQRMTIFTTNFYGFIPDEGWAFVNDGEHPVPQ